jgi:predicted esterase
MEQKQPLVGMFWGGCNEDRASDALRWHKPGEEYKRVKIAISSGSRDPVATPERVRGVVQALETAGFVNVRTFSYDGEHALDRETLRTALLWFASAK